MRSTIVVVTALLLSISAKQVHAFDAMTTTTTALFPSSAGESTSIVRRNLNSSTTPSSVKEEKALLVFMKNSGPGFAVSTWVFLIMGVLANVDVTPLLWHAQWVTFAPFFEGYAGNNTIIWDEVQPPKGNNPDGVAFRFEEFGSYLWPLALNVTWVDMRDTIALDFDTCILEEVDATTTTPTASSPSPSAETTGRRLLSTEHRRLVNVESCSFKDMRNIKRAQTFVNVLFSYLIIGIIAIVIQAGLQFGFVKKKWDAYMEGNHWIKERGDLDKAKPYTFFWIPLTGPRVFFGFVYYVAWQPVAFACFLAISTGSGKWITLGIIFFIFLILIPFGYQKNWVGKYVLGENRENFDPNIQKVLYVSNWKGWRDIVDRTTNHSWRKSRITAGFGVLFNDYYSKWKGWFSYWLILQLLSLFILSPVMPLSSKIQAVSMMAIYFMYFVTVGLMMPFRSMMKYLLHLAMCMHNGAATAVSQLIDPEGLFNMQVSEDLATKGVEGATEADGILTALSAFGLAFTMFYVGMCVLLKIYNTIQYELPEIDSAADHENNAEFQGRGKKNGSSGNLKRMDTADRNIRALNTDGRQQSSMLGNIMAANKLSRPNSNASMGSTKDSAAKGDAMMSNPMASTVKKVEMASTPKSDSSKSLKLNITTATTKADTAAKAGTNIKTATTGASTPDALPEHWVEAKDPASGKTYFHHRKTGSTQWTRPVDTAVPAAENKAAGYSAVKAELPAGWVAVVDPSSGKTYYANAITKSTQWTVPTQ